MVNFVKISQNVHNLTIKYGMTMLLIHMHELDTFYLWHESKVNQRSIEVKGVKRSFKNI